MKVLHLPYNIGSKISLTVAALRKLDVDARGIAVNNRLDEIGDRVSVFNPQDYGLLHPKKYSEFLAARKEIKEGIAWADVVHWYYDCRVLRTDGFLNWIKRLNKPAVVEWLGSDIRIPEILFLQNPYYKKMFSSGYSYQFESREHSRQMQRKFREAGFEALVRPELEEFIQKDIYPEYHKINNRIDLERYTPAYPEPGKKRPLVIHSVSSRGAKGTSYVLEAVKQLQARYDFGFMLIEDCEHREAMKKFAEADAVIDQLVLGAFGTTSLEGMALGKPVVCYVTDPLRARLPGLPLVNANPDTMGAVLETLIKDPLFRNAQGRKSRAYAEQHHDAAKIAVQLKAIYSAAIIKKSRAR